METFVAPFLILVIGLVVGIVAGSMGTLLLISKRARARLTGAEFESFRLLFNKSQNETRELFDIEIEA